jgi:predicted ATPase
MKKKYIIPFIVLTGGPCAGKTTALQRFKKLLREMGFTPLVISETATIIIAREQKKNIVLTNLERQRIIAKHQLSQEEKFLIKAEKLVEQGKKPVIICDRGLIDNKAYCTVEEWKILQQEFPALEDTYLFKRYHGGIFLVTAPKQHYRTDNNASRTESTHKHAKKVNDATLLVYEQMLNLHRIKNNGGYEKKILKAEIVLINHIKRLDNIK